MAGFSKDPTGIEIADGSGYTLKRTARNNVLDFTGGGLVNVPLVVDGEGNNSIIGGAGGETITGRSGNDTMSAGSDFQLSMAGVISVTYNAAGDYFQLA